MKKKQQKEHIKNSKKMPSLGGLTADAVSEKANMDTARFVAVLKNMSDISGLPVEYIVDGFIKHPPDTIPIPIEELHNLKLALSISDFDDKSAQEVCVPLMINIHTFNSDHDPIAAIDSFVIAHKAGLYPDLSVLEWLYRAFIKWGEEKGKPSLDELLGLKIKGGTASKPLKKRILKHRDNEIFFQVFKLKYLFSIPIEIGAECIHDLYKLKNIKIPAVEIIKRDYRLYRKTFERLYAEYLDKLTNEIKRKIIEPYLKTVGLKKFINSPSKKNRKLTSFLYLK